jgi:hypothetical protein
MNDGTSVALAKATNSASRFSNTHHDSCSPHNIISEYDLANTAARTTTGMDSEGATVYVHDSARDPDLLVVEQRLTVRASVRPKPSET